MVLGAGGAARAILHGLLAEGVTRILLANRTRGRAEALAQAFGPAVDGDRLGATAIGRCRAAVFSSTPRASA